MYIVHGSKFTDSVYMELVHNLLICMLNWLLGHCSSKDAFISMPSSSRKYFHLSSEDKYHLREHPRGRLQYNAILGLTNIVDLNTRILNFVTSFEKGWLGASFKTMHTCRGSSVNFGNGVWHLGFWLWKFGDSSSCYLSPLSTMNIVFSVINYVCLAQY